MNFIPYQFEKLNYSLKKIALPSNLTSSNTITFSPCFINRDSQDDATKVSI